MNSIRAVFGGIVGAGLVMLAGVPLFGFAPCDMPDFPEVVIADAMPDKAPVRAERVRYFRANGRSYAAIDLSSTVTLTMVRIPAATFQMGSPDSEAGRYDSEQLHEVTLTKDYWMGETEVTRAQFACFVKETGYVTVGERAGWAWGWTGTDWGRVDGATWRNPSIPQPTEDHPVVSVAWADADAFAKWLAARSGLAVSLPTEAQWENACRAGTRTRYWWGDDASGAAGLANVAGLETRTRFGWDWSFNFDDGVVWTAPVRQYSPNGNGLYDMAGNVWEWSADWIGQFTADPQTDPTGPASGDVRAIRGGSWGVVPDWVRSASRGFHAPEDCVIGLGIRVAAAIPPAEGNAWIISSTSQPTLATAP